MSRGNRKFRTSIKSLQVVPSKEFMSIEDFIDFDYAPPSAPDHHHEVDDLCCRDMDYYHSEVDSEKSSYVCAEPCAKCDNYHEFEPFELPDPDPYCDYYGLDDWIYEDAQTAECSCCFDPGFCDCGEELERVSDKQCAPCAFEAETQALRTRYASITESKVAVRLNASRKRRVRQAFNAACAP